MPTQPADRVSSRVLISSSPFPSAHQAAICAEDAPWPAKWISVPNATKPVVAAYRRVWTQAAATKVRLHATGDERYELWLNGRLLGRGPERCTPSRWAFDSYEVELPAGENVLVARVWALGKPHCPPAQFSAGHAFFVAPEPAELRDQIGTGFALWEGRVLGGREYLPKGAAFGQSAFERHRGGDVSWRTGHGSGWAAVQVLGDVRNRTGMYVGANERRLVPAELPPQIDRPVRGGVVRFTGPMDSFDGRWREVLSEGAHVPQEAAAWQRWWDAAEPVVVPARTRRRVIVDLKDYYCVYPELRVLGGRGARIGVHWEESLYTQPVDRAAHGKPCKGHRDGVAGHYYCGFGEEYLLEGGEETFDTLWWRPGRYVELAIETADEPVTLLGCELRETRFPYFRESTFESSDTRLDAVLTLCERGAAMCAHESYFDCPYYEQLQYLGDTAIQALITMASSRDARLVRRWLRLANDVRSPDGITAASFSSGMMVIPTFGFYWIQSLRDYLWWRGDAAMVLGYLPGARAVVDYWLRGERRDGLVVSPEGWNFIDWINEPRWHTGKPPGGLPGEVSGLLNWQVVWALSVLADLERLAGEPEMAARWERVAGELQAALDRTCWDAGKRLYADMPGSGTFSQHTQVFALMSGRLDAAKRAALAEGIAGDAMRPATVSFSHYVLEALYLTGKQEAFSRRLDEWREMPSRGFVTPPVRGLKPEDQMLKDDTRSDCHAWGSHPLFHVSASVLGVRPAAPGFAKVRVAPMLAPGAWARGTMPHPSGTIRVDLRRAADGAWVGEVELPAGVEGVFEVAGGAMRALKPGKNAIGDWV